ncbi:MAG: hypothetical protein RIB67_04450 [Miltoncostaeaceae bacterium]
MILAGIAIGALLVLRPWADDGPPPEPPAAAPDLRGAPLDLRAAPWALQEGGSPALDTAPPTQSLVFPPGVGYAPALRLIVQSARQDGRVPAAATPAGPLPPEVVIVRPASPREGLRVSLLAPFGWTPDTRLIRPASLRLPAAVSLRGATARLRGLAVPGSPLPRGVAVDVPRLEPCQIAVGTPDDRPACP